MDNWEATIQAAATRVGVTLKVKQCAFHLGKWCVYDSSDRL